LPELARSSVVWNRITLLRLSYRAAVAVERQSVGRIGNAENGGKKQMAIENSMA